MAESLHRRRGAQLNAEINVTSLVDVAFTLLVIFIITAPIMQGGIEIEIPKAESQPITNPDAVVVTIEADGAVHVGDVPVGSIEEFKMVASRVVQEAGASAIYIQGDANARYESFLQVFGALKALDIGNVGLIAVDPELER